MEIKCEFWICFLIHFVFGLTQAEVLPELNLFNVSYGNDFQQIMDIYLPKGRNETATKVILLIHGGGWAAGSKADMIFAIPFVRASFPQQAIVNMEYRLGTITSPAFPKQIQDVGKVIEHLKAKKDIYKLSPQFGLIGASAGAHLALLYGYGFDASKDIKVISSVVGPTNFADPIYVNVPAYKYGLLNLVGNFTYAQNPQLYKRVSPIYYIKPGSPKTIGFYGDIDFLVPKSQGEILEETLDVAGVCNKYYLYPGAGHGNWSAEQAQHMARKLAHFFRNYL